jgi:hypothetical protein
MLSNDLCLNLIGIDVKMLSQVNTETQAIEEGAGISTRSCPALVRAISARGSGGSVITNITAPGAARTIRGTMSR